MPSLVRKEGFSKKKKKSLVRKESSNKETRCAIFKCCGYIICFRLRLGVHKGMELNGININWMF